MAAHTDRHPTEWGAAPATAKNTARAKGVPGHVIRAESAGASDSIRLISSMRSANDEAVAIPSANVAFDGNSTLPRRDRRSPVYWASMPSCSINSASPELGDATNRHPEEVGELLRCSPFEERADHDQTVTIGQETDGVTQITVEFAQLELGGRFDRVLIGEQVDQREILLALVWRRVFED